MLITLSLDDAIKARTVEFEWTLALSQIIAHLQFLLSFDFRSSSNRRFK